MQLASRTKMAAYLCESGLSGDELDLPLLNFSDPAANFQPPRKLDIRNMRIKAGKQLFGQTNSVLWG